MQKSKKPLLTRSAVALGAVMALSGAAVLPAATAQAADTHLQLAACKANPCAAKKAANPCAGKNPCAAKKASNPCASKNPCAAKKASNPCAGKNPCAAKK